MKLYLVNENTPQWFYSHMLAFEYIEMAIDYVENNILTEPFFADLSKKQREDAALEWVEMIEVF